MSLCVFAQLIVPYPGHGLPYRVLSKNNAECPPRILKSYKDTPHGTSVHNDSPANPHEIKVFWQQANTFH